MENNEQKNKMGRKRANQIINSDTGDTSNQSNDGFHYDIGDNPENAPVETAQQPIVPPVQQEVVPPIAPPVTPPVTPELDDKQSKDFTDPLLAQNVDTKAYGKGVGEQNIPLGDIPEAKFTPPKNIVTEASAAKPPVQQIPQSEKIPPLNAEVSNMSDAEKKAGAELTVGAFWSGYEKINLFMGMLLKFSNEERIKMHNEGRLDLNMKVKVAIDGTIVSVNEFYEQYNKDVKEVFTVDPALKARLTEPMKREAMRLGLIMSDKQVILLGLGEDIFTKAVQCFSIKKAMNNFTKAMEEQFERNKKEMKAHQEAEKKKSNLIDPDTIEGQERMYEIYKKIKEMEVSEVEKAKATSDLFETEVTPTTTVVHEPESKESKEKEEFTEAVVVVEESGNPNVNNEL